MHAYQSPSCPFSENNHGPDNSAYVVRGRNLRSARDNKFFFSLRLRKYERGVFDRDIAVISRHRHVCTRCVTRRRVSGISGIDSESAAVAR